MPKKKKPVLKAIIIILVSAVALAIAFPPVFNLSLNRWYYFNACEVRITYRIDDTVMLDMYPDDRPDDYIPDFSGQKSNELYYQDDGNEYELKFPGFEKSVSVQAMIKKHSFPTLKTCFNGSGCRYLVFSTVKNGHLPLTNKNHLCDRLYRFDSSGGEINLIFESGNGEYILFADENRIICFDSFNHSLVEIKNNEHTVVKDAYKRDEYKITVHSDEIIINGRRTEL